MCIRVNVSFPKLNKFLLLYPLRTGTFITLFCFLARCVACLAFAITAIPELFTGGNKAFNNYILTTDEATFEGITDKNYLVYGFLIALIMTETTHLVHVAYLSNGLFCGQVTLIKLFIISRGFTWILEMLIVVLLSFVHRVILGWYLVMLMIFIIELYSFGVTYSYYCELLDKPPPCTTKCSQPPSPVWA